MLKPMSNQFDEYELVGLTDNQVSARWNSEFKGDVVGGSHEQR